MGDPTLEEKLAALRAEKWSVAVHNDYRQAGEARTFWLFTHPSGPWVKGEGRTDAEALERVLVQTGVEVARRSCRDHADCDAAMSEEIRRGGTFLHHPPKPRYDEASQRYVCDTCGRHSGLIIANARGTFCQEHASDASKIRRALRDLLMSRDVSWEENGKGHDWCEAVEAAREALGDPLA